MEHALTKLYSNYRWRARRDGLVFELTREEFRALTKRNCHYCGRRPGQTYMAHLHSYVYNGIDRVKNSDGYRLSNVVAACWECNRWKGALSTEQFILQIARVAKHLITASRRG